MNFLIKIYDLYAKILHSVVPFVLLVVRGYIGYRFFRTGMGKLENLPAVTEYFSSLGIPFPGLNACMAGLTEMLGGGLLLIGFGSRIVALPLITTMTVAYLTAHKESVLGFIDDPSAFFSQEPFPFLATALLVLFTGAGRWSVDEVIRHRLSSSNARKDTSM